MLSLDPRSLKAARTLAPRSRAADPRGRGRDHRRNPAAVIVASTTEEVLYLERRRRSMPVPVGAEKMTVTCRMPRMFLSSLAWRKGEVLGLPGIGWISNTWRAVRRPAAPAVTVR